MIIGDLEIRLRADIARLQRDMDGARGTVDRATASIARAANAAKMALAGMGMGIGLSQVVALADQYTKFTAQLKLATQSQREYAIAMGDVQRIAKAAQADISATGVLYARIANGTQELGLAQSKVAAITETVNMALKVSGATTEESASAMLQLSQAFASGTLRGEEFNAVNEAAPRLMKALAEGMGVPVGALKQMATEGKITSMVMAEALPKALSDLREEAKSVQTISGAFTGLKNEVLQFVGTQAQASGSVSVLTSGIGALANNLGLLAGVILTVTAAKFATWLAGMVTQTYASIAANQALVASNLATAQSHATAAAAALALTTTRVAELRASVLAAEGEVALAITLNGLIPAQARAALAADAHAASLVALATAQKAASVSGTLASGAMSLLGGPIGWITTLLGLGVTAWMLWGKSADDANKQASASVEASGIEIIANLDKQNAKLRERIALAKAGNPDAAKAGGADVDRLASTLKQINDLKSKGSAITGVEQIQLIDLNGTYGDISKRLEEQRGLNKEITNIGQQSKSAEWMEKLATKAEKMNAELTKARKELGDAFSPEIEKRIRAQYEEKDKGAAKAQAAIKKESGAYATLMASIGEKVAAGKLELIGYDQLSESQKLTIKLDEAVKAGKKELTPAHIANAKALIAERAAQEAVIAANKQILADMEARNAARKSEQDGIEAYFQAQQDGYNAAVKGSKDALKSAQDEYDQFGMSKSQIAEITLLTLESTKAKYLDGSAGAIAAQQQIDAQKELIGVLRRTDVKEEYSNIFKSIDQTAHDTFISIFDSGKSAFDRLRDALKNGLLDLLYQMTIKKWILSIGASVTGSSVPGMASAADGAGGIGSTVSMLSSVKTAYSAITSGFSGLSASVQGGVTSGMQSLGIGAATPADMSVGVLNGTSGAASMAGTAAGYAGGMAAGKVIGSAISGEFGIAGHGSAVVNVATVAGAIIGGPIGAAIGGAIGGLANRLFGMGDKKVTSAGIEGNFGVDGFDGNTFSNWKQKGGLFRSDKKGKDIGALDDETVRQFTDGFSSIKSVSSDFAKSLGIDATSIAAYSQKISLVLTSDAAKNQEAITKLFSDMGDTLATQLAPNIAEFSRSGETSSATLQRLSVSLSGVNGMFDTLNLKMYDVSIAGGDMASKLVDLFGGLEKMQATSSAYFQSYYSEQEKVDIATRQLSKTFADLGFVMPEATEAGKAALRAQIEARQALGESAQSELVQLMGLSGSFAALTSATEQLATSTADAARAATDAAKEAADAAMAASQDARDRAKAATDAALQAVQRAIDAEKSRISVIRDVAAESVRSITGVFGLLNDQISQIYGTVGSTSAMQASQGNAFIDQALAAVQSSGYLPDQQQLASAIAAARGGLDASQFATQFEADKAALVMAGKLSQLQTASGYQLTAAEQSLKIANDQLNALDSQLEYAQKQVDALNGINTSVLGVTAAIAGLASAMSAQAAAKAAASSAPISTGAFNSNASVDASHAAVNAYGAAYGDDAYYFTAGVNDYAAKLANATTAAAQIGVSIADAFDLLGHSQEYWKEAQAQFDAGLHPTTTSIRGFASGGDFGGGLRIVGENGPEIEATGPSRIFNASQTRSMLSGGGNTERLERLVEGLTAEVQRLQGIVADGNKNTSQLADQFDNVTEGGNGIRNVTIEVRT